MTATLQLATPTRERTAPAHNALRRLRLASGLTQRGVSEHVEVSALEVARWERGRAAIPEAHQARLSALFAVSIAHLMGRG